MTLTKLEIDILEEMNQDTYELWEWYSFIRTNFPGMEEIDVVNSGYRLFESWISRNWLIFYEARTNENIIEPQVFLSNIKDMGMEAANPEKSTVVLEITEQVGMDVDWIQPKKPVGPR